MLFGGLLVLFIASFFALGYFRRFALNARVLLDVPNHRSNHRRVTVRGAGIVFVAATLSAWIALACSAWAVPYLIPLICGSGLVAGVSFIDDFAGLSIRVRLEAHLVGALLFLSAVPVPSFLEGMIGPFSVLWIPLTAFFMVAVINIYNFMDGIDGLVTLHSLCVLVSWVLFSMGGRDANTETLLCLMLGFPLLSFLLHNWSPAKVFMGDVGSTFLGFTFAALAVVQAPGILRSANFFTLIMLMMPALFDATFTILTRFLNGEKWYLAHNGHLFQRLVRGGLSHATVTSIYGALTVYMGVIVALIQRQVLVQSLEVTVLLVIPYLGLYFAARRLEEEQGAQPVSALSPLPPLAPVELKPQGISITKSA